MRTFIHQALGSLSLSLSSCTTAVLMRNGIAAAVVVRSRGLDVERRGLLIAQTVVIKHGQNEIHQLRVSTIDRSLATVLDVLNIRLEVSLLAESIGGQGYQEFSKEFYAVLMPALVALMLPLRPRPLLWSGLLPADATSSPSRPPRPPPFSSVSPSDVCTARKSTGWASVFIERSLIASWAAHGLSREPLTVGDLSASLEAERSPDLRCGDGPSVPLHLEGGGHSSGGGSRSHDCLLSLLCARGMLRDTIQGLQLRGASLGTCEKG
ncbi:hypothetical protein Cgig2_010639 [Carnegiea gigantea]|uniref:Uncharacterized protein n=1 Tax=Carnegiea gigantea TaxID=171969 RepID=A0A9Q1GLV7_9CARY|nr:hypothetical protein Cgig2_010639 [Carnegiea gigantea]